MGNASGCPCCRFGHSIGTPRGVEQIRRIAATVRKTAVIGLDE
jgi:hypothetical protein|tara:strand:- start:676 stop:804 length:129 start_codon:yes stop_codon:yes gene_type:complete